MKKLSILFIMLCVFMYGCSANNETNVIEGSDVDLQSEMLVEQEEEVQDVITSKTFDMKEEYDKSCATYVFIYDIMDNGETVTVIPGVYNNSYEELNNFVLIYDFIKDNEVVYSVEKEVNEIVEANGGFLGLTLFLAEIKQEYFDKIEINMKN